MTTSLNVIVAITGGIASYKSATLVRRLQDLGCIVRVIMTEGAQAFITPLTLQALSGYPVHTSLLDEQAELGMGHIELAKWADCLIVAPATANSMAKIAHGFADDLLGAVVLATASPIWFAPAMNQQMWKNPATQNNIQHLKKLGYHIIPPAQGIQACGDLGAGRLPEPEWLADYLVNALREHQATTTATLKNTSILAGKKVVITAGPTREALDPVRYLSNNSTGKMGFALAEACRDAGATVTLIAGPVSLATPNKIQRINIMSAIELLDASLTAVNTGCDIFIATAAVADFRPINCATQKIKKTGTDAPIIELIQNPDIVATIAQHPNRPFMVGFAAETERMEEYAQRKLKSKLLDMIACNDVSRQDIGFGADNNAMTVFFADHHALNTVVLEKASKNTIANELVNCMAQALLLSQEEDNAL